MVAPTKSGFVGAGDSSLLGAGLRSSLMPTLARTANGPHITPLPQPCSPSNHCCLSLKTHHSTLFLETGIS
jgi:hypothetical protein